MESTTCTCHRAPLPSQRCLNTSRMFATFPELFATVYGFSSGSTGLTYLGLGIGFILATGLGGHYGNTVYLHVRRSFFVTAAWTLKPVYCSSYRRITASPNPSTVCLLLSSAHYSRLSVFCEFTIYLCPIHTLTRYRSWYGWSAQAGIHWIMPIIGYVHMLWCLSSLIDSCI